MGNRSFEETLVGMAASAVETALPLAWSLSTKTTTPPFDATMSITAPTGQQAEIAVAVKRWTTAPTSAVAGVLSQLQARTPMPVLLATDYTNRPLREACETLGINYVDETGWVFLRLDAPAIFIRTDGGSERAAPRVASEVIRLNGIAVSRTIRALLEVNPPIGVRDLASRARVRSPGSVSKLLPTLAAADAIARDGSGQIVGIKRRALLDRWVQDYSFLNGNGVVLDYLAPRGLDGILNRLKGDTAACVTGAFAAKEYLRSGLVPVAPATRLTLYCADGSDWARNLGLIRVDRASSNVIVAAPRDREILTNPSWGPSGMPLAPLPQVLADLLTLPGRETALADQLIDQLAQSDPLWRTQE